MDWGAKVELYEKIRRKYFEGVRTILRVAQKLGVHRRMVSEAIRTAVPAKRKKMEREGSRLIAAVLLFIHQILTADQQAPRKQRHTVQCIYQRLREEMPQQEVSPRSIRRAVKEWKQQHQSERTDTYISQYYEAGREGQADWYEAYAHNGTNKPENLKKVGLTGRIRSPITKTRLAKAISTIRKFRQFFRTSFEMSDIRLFANVAVSEK